MKSFIVWIVLFLAASLVGGWVSSILWNWFIVPVLHLPILTPLPAIGLVYALRYLVNGVSQTKTDKVERLVANEILLNQFVYGIIVPLLVLFFGWVYFVLIY